MKKSQQRVQALRDSISELSPEQARTRQEDGALLIDIREPEEVACGSPLGARRIVRGFLELRIEDVAPDEDTELLLICGGGVRSLFAADDLERMGYTNVHSVEGGFTKWTGSGLPAEVPGPS